MQYKQFVIGQKVFLNADGLDHLRYHGEFTVQEYHGNGMWYLAAKTQNGIFYDDEFEAAE